MTVKASHLIAHERASASKPGSGGACVKKKKKKSMPKAAELDRRHVFPII